MPAGERVPGAKAESSLTSVAAWLVGSLSGAAVYQLQAVSSVGGR